jgi:hypothetical protein
MQTCLLRCRRRLPHHLHPRKAEDLPEQKTTILHGLGMIDLAIQFPNDGIQAPCL